jgi:hypothetical protein
MRKNEPITSNMQDKITFINISLFVLASSNIITSFTVYIIQLEIIIISIFIYTFRYFFEYNATSYFYIYFSSFAERLEKAIIFFYFLLNLIYMDFC